MTVGGTVLKSLVLFVVTCAFAVVGWDHAARVIKATSGPSWLLGYFVLIALSFLAIANPRLAPIGGFVYAVLMGLWVGGISQVYEVAYDGIVAQALMATMAIVLVCLAALRVRAREGLSPIRARGGRGDAGDRSALPDRLDPQHLRGRPAVLDGPLPGGDRDQRGDLHRGGAQPVHRLRRRRPGVKRSARPRSWGGTRPGACWPRSSGCTSRCSTCWQGSGADESVTSVSVSPRAEGSPAYTGQPRSLHSAELDGVGSSGRRNSGIRLPCPRR